MLTDRFWSKVVEVSECWVWVAAVDRYGYGKFSRGGRTGTIAAHRAAYECLVGEVPQGLELDHVCRNKACVNPAHLEPVSRLENIRRREHYNSRKTHCPNGHGYDYLSPSGQRSCNRCARDRYAGRR